MQVVYTECVEMFLERFGYLPDREEVLRFQEEYFGEPAQKN